MLSGVTENSTVNKRNSVWNTWAIAPVFTVAVLVALVLYFFNPFGKSPVFAQATVSVGISINAAKRNPEQEVKTHTPPELARLLREFSFSPEFSPKIASMLHAGPGTPAPVLLEDAKKDPVVAKLLAIVKEPTNPYFQETCAALKDEANEYISNVAASTFPGTALVLPMLLVEASASPDTALLLYQMEQCLAQGEAEGIERHIAYTGRNTTYISGDISRLLAYTIEQLFVELGKDPQKVQALPTKQQAVLSEFNDYLCGRRDNMKVLASALASQLEEKSDANAISDTDLDNFFWRVSPGIGTSLLRVPDDCCGENHELYLRRLLRKFVGNHV